MEIDALVLLVIVISVSITTFVCSILGKYCSAKFLIPNSSRLPSPRPRQKSRNRRRSCSATTCHCHCGKSNNNVRKSHHRRYLNDPVAINICPSSGEQIQLNTLGPLAPPAAPGAGGISGNEGASQTFLRLGIKSSRDGGKNFDLERQFQLSADLNSPERGHSNNNNIILSKY